MASGKETTGGPSAVRPLTPADYDRVLAIDAAQSGRRREGFYGKRLAATREGPGEFIYVGIDCAGTLAGFAFAQLLEGEFGGRGPVAQLDAIAIDPAHGHEGLGRALMDGLVAVMARKGVHELRTQVDWRNDRLLHFLAANGFEAAPRLVLERPTSEPL